MTVRSPAAPVPALARQPFSLSPVAALCRHWGVAGVFATAASGALAQSPAPADTPAALPRITVKAKTETSLAPALPGGQVARGGSLGLLGQQDVMDTPFSTVNYTSELLENQQVRTLADVLVNDASVRMTTGSTGFDDTFQIRGYAVSATDVGFNGLYGLISPNHVHAQIVERVELLKGPGALLNGISPSGSVGGGINVVSKRAGDVPLTRLATVYTGKSNFSQGVDVGRRFGLDNAWGVRFNGLVRDGEATIDDGNQRTGLGALAVDYLGARVRWSLDAIVQRDDTDNFRPQISLDAVSTTIPSPADARVNWYPGTTLVQKDATLATRLEVDVNDAATAYAGIGYRDGKNEQVFPQSTSPVNPAGQFTVRNNYYDSYTKTTSGNAGVRWRFDTAGVGHTVTAGVTAMTQEAGNVFVTGASSPSSIYDPVPLPAITSPRTEPNKASDTTLTSIALADTLSIDGGRWLVTLGARDQTVRVRSFSTTTGAENPAYKASRVTPLAGVVFKPLANVSVYGNYTAGLSRGEIVGPGYSNTGAVLPPFRSEQYEAGVKVDWGRVTTSAAVYQLTRPSAVGASTSDSRNARTYDGEQRNRGVELSAVGEIQSGLRGIASVAYVDPTLKKTAGGVNEGNDAAGVPNVTASAGADWETPWVRGLAVNGRVIYTSGAYLTAANTARFDRWTRVDIGARYAATLAETPVVFRANVENLFDKAYWLTTGTYVAVGSPRTLVLSATVDF